MAALPGVVIPSQIQDRPLVPKLFKFVLPLLILALGVIAFKALMATRPERPTARIEERIWRVEVEAVAPSLLAPQLVLYGRVENPDLLKVAASGPARVATVAVREGQRVQDGELLIQLDERDFLPALKQAKAQVAELKAQIESEKTRHLQDRTALEQEKKLLEIAANGVERAQRLKKQRVGSDSDLDSAEESLARQILAVSSRESSIADHPARLDALEARLQSALAKLAEAELDLERATVSAPFDGVVTGVEVTAGDQVKQDAVLLRFYSTADLEVRARISAPYQAEIASALAAGETLEAESDVGDGERVQLRLERLSGEAQASGVDGLFAVKEGADGLRLGQMLKLRLNRTPRDGVIPVPFEAVYGGDRLYKLEEGRMRGIRVESLGGWTDGRGDERLLVRSSDLGPGDQVVITHMPNAVDGLRVEAIR
jgi:multidrug efflux pump subunit AcrA (membrane-fusion protein)